MVAVEVLRNYPAFLVLVRKCHILDAYQSESVRLPPWYFAQSALEVLTMRQKHSTPRYRTDIELDRPRCWLDPVFIYLAAGVAFIAGFLGGLSV